MPTLPARLGAFSFTSPLASVVYDGSKRLSGYYAPRDTSLPLSSLELNIDLSAMGARQWHVKRAHKKVEASAILRLEFEATIIA